ncbi:MAG: DUF6089 family protein [Bacteroidota bacterium]
MKNAIFVFALLIASQLQAQQVEIGLMLGASSYSGDIPAGSSELSLRNARPAASLFGRYFVKDFFALRVGLTAGSFQGDDSNSPEHEKRNLSFRSRLFEAQAVGELHLPLQKMLNSQNALSPYLYGGVALFHFNPQALFQGRWVDLQPLGTEGQGINGNPDPYSRWQISIPFGGGIRVGINRNWTVGVEFGVRRTFTDYLDDVSGNYPDPNSLLAANGSTAVELSYRGDELPGNATDVFPAGEQRGSAEFDDWYGTGGVTISYRFDNSNRESSHNASCPKF